MVDHAALVHALGDYAQALLTNFDIGSMLYRLTDHVTAVLGADGAGVCGPTTTATSPFVAATDGNVVDIEEQQIATRQGPCHQGLPHRRARRGDRPRERPALAGLPPRRGRGRCAHRAGSPDAGRGTPHRSAQRLPPGCHDWDDAETAVAQALANMASGYVLNAGALERLNTLATQLQHALDSRIVVEQAKGILAERHQIPPAAAFHRLRSHARHHQLRVHDLAQDIIDGTATL